MNDISTIIKKKGKSKKKNKYNICLLQIQV